MGDPAKPSLADIHFLSPLAGGKWNEEVPEAEFIHWAVHAGDKVLQIGRLTATVTVTLTVTLTRTLTRTLTLARARARTLTKVLEIGANIGRSGIVAAHCAAPGGPSEP